MLSPRQIKMQIAASAKRRRLEKNLSRKTLSERSGIPASTIRHFEATGNAGLPTLLAIAMALECLDEFACLFQQKTLSSLYQLPKPRKRGRQ